MTSVRFLTSIWAGITLAAICGPASAANFPLAPFACSLRDPIGSTDSQFSFQLSPGDGRGQVEILPLDDSSPVKGKILFMGTSPSQIVAPDGDQAKLTLTIFGSADTTQGKASFWVAETVARTATIENFDLNLEFAGQKLPSKCVLVTGAGKEQ